MTASVFKLLQKKNNKLKKVIDNLSLLPYNNVCISSDGRIAQLGEHLPYKQGVIGSSPIATTMFFFEVAW